MNVIQNNETPTPVQTNTGFERNLAFVIGINNYQSGISPLKTAVNDAKEIIKVLREKHGYEVWVCLDEVATLSNLNKFLEKTLPENLTENDRLLFYFAGHGVALNGDEGPAGYLIPQDAKQGDTNSYLPMTKLHDALSQLPCRHFLGILDCCFAGAFRWSSTRDFLAPSEVIYQERYDRFIRDAAWQIITSSASDQKALDNFKLDTERGEVGNHSPFAAALLEALAGAADSYPPAKNCQSAGDGVITATELYLYLRDRVEIPTEKSNMRQTPGIWCLNKHDKGEYIFLSPSHELNLPPAPPLDESKNPYRGLNSFEEEHSELFFGRSQLVDKLQDFVKTNPLTVVLGASGSGKSSLVKAGLIPKLKQETSQKWYILPTIRPGETPFQAFNKALIDGGLSTVELENRQKTLAQSVGNWVKNNPNSKLLLFIDQTEEIITLCKNEHERKEFFQQILTAINAHRHQLRVILTLRSDFESQVRDAGLKFVCEELNLGNTFLQRRWQNGRFIVPAMTRSQLREAIEKPAISRVMYFQPNDLVEQLIDEVADMPGALPLLSFALSELFLKYLKRQRNAEFNQGKNIDRALTQADYQELGGVMRSLTQRADEEYEALVRENPDYESVIRHVMLRMVAIGGGELARRRVPLSELQYPPEKDNLVKEVIKRFSIARLLVEGQDSEGNPYVEPAHDALVRGWEKLLVWKQKEEENLILQRRLTPAAEEWKIQQQPRFLWNGNPRLDLLKKELNSRDNWFNTVETEFVERSVKRKTFNTRLYWGIAVSVMLGLSGLSIWALSEQRKAVIDQIKTSRQASETGLRTNNFNLETLIQSLQAAKSRKNWLLQVNAPDKQLQEQIIATLRKAVYLNREDKRWQVPEGEIVKATFVSQEFKLLVTTANNERTICLRDLEKSTKQCQELANDIGLITKAEFSPDGKKIAWEKQDSTGFQIWNWGNGQFYDYRLSNPSSRFRFTPDSQALAFMGNTQNGQSFVSRWNWENNQVDSLVEPGNISNFNFTPSGNLLVTTTAKTKDDKQTLNLWERNSGWKSLAKFPVGFSTVDLNIISPDGQSLVMSYGSGRSIGATTELWKVGEETPIRLSAAPIVSYSADGKHLAVGDNDGTVKFFQSGSQFLELKGHQGLIYSLNFSPDAKQLITVGNDNTIRLWNLDTEIDIQPEKQLPNPIQKISFSPDSKQIATLEAGTIHLWDISSGQQLREFSERKYSEESQLIFHPQGKQLAIIEPNDQSNTIHLLNLSSGKVSQLPGEYLSVSGLSFSPNGKRLAIFENVSHETEDTGSLRLLDLTKQKEQKTGWNLKSSETIWKSDSKGNEQILAARADVLHTVDNVEVWNTLSNKQLASLFVGRGTMRDLSQISFNRDGSLVALSFGWETKLWDWQNNQSISFIHSSENNEVKFSKISPDGKILAVVDQQDKVKLLYLGGFEELVTRGCKQVRDYLQNNPNVSESDRHLCEK
ncbi:nSTAND1 domain-containing NTPase [Calothrix sp. 336/3]|uniref:nSTAND1 domain-containing NTPase n=1 Tax=Calothrix sp. 336/3 TaxID=1337936 RepID=UPI0006245890|nr:caspase family protein [Calothrix sp. 336/3]AKG20277.1 hypothetical protein IJ00_02180 [Calothrix sp. 336/3]